MATYFNSISDYTLLTPGLRHDSTLATVSEQVEHEVIARYREFVGNDWQTLPDNVVVDADRYAVMLRGYQPDSDDAEAKVKDALRRTIARVVSHRLSALQTGAEAGVTAWSEGARSRSYGRAIDPDWPRNWQSLLVPFMLRKSYAW